MKKPAIRNMLRFSILTAIVIALVSMTACSSGGSGYRRAHTSYGVGYGGYYGHRPWGHYPGYVGGGPVDPDWGVEPGGPVATPLPEMGMPDMGMGGMDMGMGMDMGGFDF
jgi:hypothetical protein